MTPDTNTEQLSWPDIEAILARHTVRRAVWVAPPLVALFWLVSGPMAGFAAFVGVAIVAGNFMLSGWILSLAARISLSMYHAAALFGFFLRLGLVTAAMFAVAWIFDIDRIALGVSAIVSYLGLLTWEAVSVARGEEKELEWTT